MQACENGGSKCNISAMRNPEVLSVQTSGWSRTASIIDYVEGCFFFFETQVRQQILRKLESGGRNTGYGGYLLIHFVDLQKQDVTAGWTLLRSGQYSHALKD